MFYILHIYRLQTTHHFIQRETTKLFRFLRNIKIRSEQEYHRQKQQQQLQQKRIEKSQI